MAIASSDKLVVVKAFAPSNPLPLDAREIHESLAEAKAYAATSAIAYAGQDIKVVENGTVTVYTLVPSEKEGVKFDLQFVGGGGSGIQSVGTSNVAGNISVVSVEGDTAVTKDVPVVGAFVDVAVTADTETLAEKTEFTYKDASNAEQKKVVYATGTRKVEAGAKGKVKVTNAGADGALTTTEIAIASGVAPTYDQDSRTITLPYLAEDGSEATLTVALGKDMVVTSGTYNAETKDIELTLTDGTVVKVPAAELVDVYTGTATATVTVTVGSNNVISAAVKLSTAEGNLLKSDENGLYVVESDFTATKQLISDGDAAAKSYASGLVTAEATARGTAIEAALTEAKEYTDTEKESTIATINQTISTKVGEITTAYETAISSAKEEVKGYTDQEVAKAEAAAKEYAEGLLEDADVSGVVADALEEAKAYTDQEAGKVSTALTNAMNAEVEARNTAIATAKGEATAYTDQEVGKVSEALTNAINGEVEARNAAIATAKEEAVNHTNTEVGKVSTALTTAVGEITTAYSNAIDAAKTELTEYIDTQDGATLTDAKGYTAEEIGKVTTAYETAIDEAIDAEVEARDTAITNAINGEVTARNTAIATAKEEAIGHTNTEIGKVSEALTNAINGEVEARNTAIATAKGEATDYADTQDLATLNAAKAYTDQVAEALTVKWVDFGAAEA